MTAFNIVRSRKQRKPLIRSPFKTQRSKMIVHEIIGYREQLEEIHMIQFLFTNQKFHLLFHGRKYRIDQQYPVFPYSASLFQ